MQNTSSSKITRSRRSCESCRRKKVRCDGERPVCSFCRRLRQECTYKNRRDEVVTDTQASSIQTSPHPNDSTGRLQVLESKVNDLYGILNGRDADKDASTRSVSEPTDPDVARVNVSPSLRVGVHGGNFILHDGQTISKGKFQQIGSSDLSHAVQIYIDYIHGQPLLLFDPSNMIACVETWPSYLRQILQLAASRWTQKDVQIATGFDRSVLLKATRREIMVQAMDIVADVRILQALCLLILEEIADSDTKGAWMSIAVAARISCMSKLLATAYNSQDWLRSNWSLHILDILYCSSLGMVRALPKDMTPPLIHEIDRLSPPKPMKPSRSDRQQQSDRSSSINDCYSAILSVWSEALDLLKIGENKRLPSPWADESPYRKIVAKLYDFETDLLQVHRVRHMRPDIRDAEDLRNGRMYWSTWFSVQILFHAVQAMINHPVLHIAGVSRSQHRRPPSFLQHTVDELFQHSGWVKKLIDLGAEKDFRFNDPFIAHVTAIVATGWMFFINSDDPPLAKQAELGFEACYNFVHGFVDEWPHLKHNIEKLNSLRESVDAENSVRAPSIQASLLWSLFDYSSSTTPASTYERKTSPRLELGVATQYLSTSDSIQTPRVDELGKAQHYHTIEGMSEDHSFPAQAKMTPENDFSLFDSMLFAGFQPSNFGDDLFADFGQL